MVLIAELLALCQVVVVCQPLTVFVLAFVVGIYARTVELGHYAALVACYVAHLIDTYKLLETVVSGGGCLPYVESLNLGAVPRLVVTLVFVVADHDNDSEEAHCHKHQRHKLLRVEVCIVPNTQVFEGVIRVLSHLDGRLVGDACR